jgi:hypothetical protein
MQPTDEDREIALVFWDQLVEHFADIWRHLFLGQWDKFKAAFTRDIHVGVKLLNDETISRDWLEVKEAGEVEFKEFSAARRSMEVSAAQRSTEVSAARKSTKKRDFPPELLDLLQRLARSMSKHTPSPETFRTDILDRAGITEYREWFWPFSYCTSQEETFARRKLLFLKLEGYLAEKDDTMIRRMFQSKAVEYFEPRDHDSIYYLTKWDPELWEHVKRVQNVLHDNKDKHLKDLLEGYFNWYLKDLWVAFVRALLRCKDITPEESSELLKTLHVGGGYGPMWEYWTPERILPQDVRRNV